MGLLSLGIEFAEPRVVRELAVATGILLACTFTSRAAEEKTIPPAVKTQ